MSTAVRAVVGPMVSGHDIEAAVIAMLKAWLPSYICEYERQHGMEVGATPPPRGWTTTGRDLQKYPSDQLPAIIIMSGGIVQPPRKQGPPNAHTAIFGIEVGAVFSAAWGYESRLHAQLYATAIRTAMTQRPLDGLDGFAVDWRGEAYDEMDFADSRSYSASVASFNVEIRDVLHGAGGPPPLVTPPDDATAPWPPWQEVAEVDVEVDNVPPPETLT